MKMNSKKEFYVMFMNRRYFIMFIIWKTLWINYLSTEENF